MSVAVLVPFLIWGDWFMRTFDQAGTAVWLQRLGPWAWIAAVGLLVGDLFLPVPATAVMGALGWVYGPWVGGMIGSFGAFLSGLLACLLCRSLGDRAALRILGPEDLERGKSLFSKAGGWIIALTRWVPILPEVACCMAGLTRMPLRTFLLALACGCLPVSFTFAWIGSRGHEQPALALGLSIALPILCWGVTAAVLRRRSR